MREFGNGLEGDMEDPRPHPRVDENAQCVQGSSGATAMAMATRARMMTGTDDGKD